MWSTQPNAAWHGTRLIFHKGASQDPGSACSQAQLVQACSGSAHACAALAIELKLLEAMDPPLASKGLGSMAHAEHALAEPEHA